MPPKKTVPPKGSPSSRPVAKPVGPAAKGAKPKLVPGKGTVKKTGAGAAKKPAVPFTKAGSTPQPEKKPPERKWTKEDEAAKKIQTCVRKFLAQVTLQKKKKEKEEYEELMDRLEKEAFTKLVKMEQEKAEKERQKMEEERRRRKEDAKRKNRILEASFDGDDNEINQVLKEVKQLDDKNGLGDDVIGRNLREKHRMAMVDCEDANDNTPLSEASSGGHKDTIKMLLDMGANPNSRGRFKRTPLYRAAFAGHMEACQLLLQYGADPRLYADDGQTSEQVASQRAIQELLTEWDMEQTEILLAKLEKDRERRAEEDRQRREAQMDKIEVQLKQAQKEYELQQKMLKTKTEDLEKRIFEHDNAASMGFDKPEITLQAVHDAEADLEIAKLDIEKARNKLSGLRLKLREEQKEHSEEAGEDLPGLKVRVRELDDVLLRDVGNKIQESGKWPLLMDISGQAATFLRYRDTNYIQALSPANMEPEKIRLCVLGALRYGKPVILDMMEVDMFDNCVTRFDYVQPNLMEMIMDKSILKEENYLKLVRPGDGDAYSKTQFNEIRLNNFKFFIITKNPFPSDDLIEKTYPIRIFIPT